MSKQQSHTSNRGYIWHAPRNTCFLIPRHSWVRRFFCFGFLPRSWCHLTFPSGPPEGTPRIPPFGAKKNNTRDLRASRQEQGAKSADVGSQARSLSLGDGATRRAPKLPGRRAHGAHFVGLLCGDKVFFGLVSDVCLFFSCLGLLSLV